MAFLSRSKGMCRACNGRGFAYGFRATYLGALQLRINRKFAFLRARFFALRHGNVFDCQASKPRESIHYHHKRQPPSWRGCQA